MGLSPTDTMLGTWAPSTSPLRIQYTKAVMEEVRSRAVEGFYKLPRGGVEVAGILVGEHESDHIRIVQQVPFEIEYAYGPTFMLSPRDLAFLRKLVEETREAAVALGFKVLGLYVSHSRGELSLKDVELGLFAEMFPHDWQTILLLKPSRAPETPAAFFVREPNGQIRANRSHQEFELSPEMGERRPRPEPRSTRSQDASLHALASASTRAERPAIPAARNLGQEARVPPALQRPPDGAPPEQLAFPSESAAREEGHEDLPFGQIASPDSGVSPEEAAPPRPDSLPSVRQPGGHTQQTDNVSSLTATTRPSSPTAPPVPDGKPVHATPEVAAPPPLHATVSAGEQAGFAPGAQSASASAMERTGESAGAAIAGASVPWEDEAPTALRRGILLRWAVPVGVLVLGAVLAFLVYEALYTAPPAVVFYLQEVGDRTEVVWQLKGIRDASSAEITIETNGQRKTIDLMRSGQLSGSLSDPLLTAESLVTLNINRRSAPDIQRVAPRIGSESPVVSLLDDEQGAGTPPIAADDSVQQAAEDGAREPAAQPEPEGESPTIAGPQDETADAALIAAREEAARVAAETERLARMGAEARAAAAALASGTGESTPESAPTPSGAASLDSSSTRPSERASTIAPASASADLPATSQSVRGGQGQGSVDAAPSGSARQAGQVAQQTAPASRPRLPEADSSVDRPGNRSTANPVPAAPKPVAPVVAVPKPTVAKPTPPAKAQAGRMIWTGQLRKNQTLQIMGPDANRGTVTSALPGVPVRLSVLPGELTAKGLVVYTANPRYRNADEAIEPPGPTNGWNETRFVYNPSRANSIIVTAIPNRTNSWQAITVRNDDKSLNVIVIDWLADTE